MTSAVALSLLFVGAAHAKGQAKTPAELSQAFEQHFNAGDIDGMARLYGPSSIFVPAPGVKLQDPAQIRDALKQFTASKVPIKLTVRQIYEAGNTALVVFDWAIKGTGVDGKPVDMSGTGADVMTRQKNGNWLYAIDNPFGVAQPQK